MDPTIAGLLIFVVGLIGYAGWLFVRAVREALEDMDQHFD